MTVKITLTDDHYTVHYADEFDLRDGLARTAHMAGWGVETEHVVPGWGRPDLYLSSGDVHLAVELKVNLDHPENSASPTTRRNDTQ